jgi:hypothetical protein
MLRTLQLIEAAEATDTSLRQYSTDLGLTPNGLSKARNDGKLSPAIAAALAEALGKDPAQWALVAASESSKNPPALQRRLRAMVNRRGNP